MKNEQVFPSTDGIKSSSIETICEDSDVFQCGQRYLSSQESSRVCSLSINYQNFSNSSQSNNSTPLNSPSKNLVRFSLPDSNEKLTSSNFEFLINEDNDYFGSQLSLIKYEWELIPIDDSKCIQLYYDIIIQQWRKENFIFPSENLFLIQKEIDSIDRTNLIEWLIDICIEKKISYRSLFLTIKIFDQLIFKKEILANNTISTLLSVLSLCSKMENSNYPKINYYLDLLNKQNIEINYKDFIKFEIDILQFLDYKVYSTTIISFLKIWLNKLKCNTDKVIISMFISTICLFSHELSVVDTELLSICILSITFQFFNEKLIDPLFKFEFNYYNLEKLKKTSLIIIKYINNYLNNQDSSVFRAFSFNYHLITSKDYEIPNFDEYM